MAAVHQHPTTTGKVFRLIAVDGWMGRNADIKDGILEAIDIYEVIDREYSLIPIPARRDINNPDELCIAEEFTVVRYSTGNDEEFVTVGPSKISIVERTPGSMSCIYHKLFNRKDRGWE
ncbi:hypothetical protein Tco_0898947, partial [Tanacetum coccineum]